MEIIEVFSSSGDYAALTFEQELGGDTKKYAKLCKDNGGHYCDDESGVEFCIHTFGEIDPKFITFMRNDIMDYDDSKHHNFYEVI